jgi:hypothetical protein
MYKSRFKKILLMEGSRSGAGVGSGSVQIIMDPKLTDLIDPDSDPEHFVKYGFSSS